MTNVKYTTRLTGYEAIIAKENDDDIVLNKYMDPTEGSMDDISVEFAEDVAREDPSLIWCEKINMENKMTSKEIAKKAVDKLVEDGLDTTAMNHRKIERMIESLLKEQDKKTRHACADAICSLPSASNVVRVNVAYAACMNVQAV